MGSLANKEQLSLRGHLLIYKRYGDGLKKLFFEEDNLITKAAKQVLLRQIYPAAVTSDPIINLKVGIGGTIDPGGLYPKAEDPAQTDLITPILTIATSYVADVPNIVVTFLADVDQAQGNGQLISEAGLFKTSGDIFNVKNHPAITKTAEFSIHYEWNIRYL